MYNSSFQENCSNLSVKQLKELNMVISISAVVCVAYVLFILLLLVGCKKAFSSTFQRLYFCLMVETLIAEIAFSLSIERQFPHAYQDQVCVAVGFLIHWSDIMVYISCYEIIFYLMYLVIIMSRDKPIICAKSQCFQKIIEGVYASLPIVLPLPYVLPPYFDGHYGLAGAWCWIKSVDEQCQPVGTVDQVVAYSTNEAVGIVGMVVCFILAAVYHRRASHIKETRRLLKRTFFLMCFQIVQVAIVTIPFAVRIYALSSHVYQDYHLWFVKALLEPISKLITQIGCFICFYPMLCYPFKGVCYVKKRNISRLVTVQESYYFSRPSTTFFKVSHPDEDENSSLLQNNERYQSTISTALNDSQ